MRELYQEVILEHNKRPRNFREVPDATAKLEGFNPLCGDRLTLFVTLDGDRITDVAFKGSGCAISTSSASLMTEAVKLFEAFRRLATGTPPEPTRAEVGKLLIFSGVREFASRVKCATLCWHTLHS